MQIISQLIDSIFPPRAISLLVRTLTEARCMTLYQPRLYGDTLCLSEYRNPMITALITENKFHNNRRAARFLATLLTYWVNQKSAPLILIPVPLGKKRQRDRGYNQVAEVLSCLSLPPGMTVRTDLLHRRLETVSQVSLPRTKRLTNMKQAFSCHQARLSELRQTTVVLIDDVCTTGATIQAAKDQLQSVLHPSCRVLCVALAH